MIRRTKIIATIGPASQDPKILQQLIMSGVNLVRINMSHGSSEKHSEVIKNLRKISKELKLEVGVLLDLQGPKIRISRFKDNEVTINSGDKFILDAALGENDGTVQSVGLDYKHLPYDLKAGDRLLLDDGRIVMDVEFVRAQQIHCIVRIGGILSNNKGVNRQGGGLSAAALTDKDKEDIIFAAEHDVDYVAVSFPRNAEDMQMARNLLRTAGSQAGVIAKIERAEAIEDLTNIILASDAIMVARGDLGVEVGFAKLPALQKIIITRSRELNKAVITATQMLESMNFNNIPTRAEVSDVANAVIEGSDAVMLSAETATGRYPVQSVAVMAEVCLAAERQHAIPFLQQSNLDREFSNTEEAIAMAAMYTANHLEVKAIIALTVAGVVPLLMSRIRSEIPVYGISSSKMARGRMTLYSGVYPVNFDVSVYEKWEIIRAVLTELRENGTLQVGERVIITRGDLLGETGGANSLKIVTVEPA